MEDPWTYKALSDHRVEQHLLVISGEQCHKVDQIRHQVELDLIRVGKELVCHLHHVCSIIVLIEVLVEADQAADLNQACGQGLSHIDEHIFLENRVHSFGDLRPVWLSSVHEQKAREVEGPALFDLIDLILSITAH